MGQGTLGAGLFPLLALSQGTSRPKLSSSQGWQRGHGDSGCPSTPGGAGDVGTRAVPLQEKGDLGTAGVPAPRGDTGTRADPAEGTGGTRTRKPEPLRGSARPAAGTHRAGPRRARRSRSRCLCLYRCRCPVPGASGCARCSLSGGDTLRSVFGAQCRQPMSGAQCPMSGARCRCPVSGAAPRGRCDRAAAAPAPAA